MAIRRAPTVVDADGVLAHLRHLVEDETHTVAAEIELPDRTRVTLPAAELLPDEPSGGYAIAGRWRDYAAAQRDRVDIPVVAETVTVDVRRTARETVRVRRRVVVEEQAVETPLVEERIELERTPIDRVVDSPPTTRREGEILVIPVVTEEVVVARRYRIREELRIRVVRDHRIDRQVVSVRRHEIAIDRHEPNPDHETEEGDRS